MMRKTINACCLDHMPKMEENSVDSIVTDPPYEIGMADNDWDSAGVAYAPGVWIECRRVLKPGGYLLAFSATRTYHRLAEAVENVGFEVKDVIAWMYASGVPKGRNTYTTLSEMTGVPVCGCINGRIGEKYEGDQPLPDHLICTDCNGIRRSFGNSMLRPSMELILMARNPIGEPTVAKNVRKWGAGSLNTEANRLALAEGEKHPSLRGGDKSSYITLGRKIKVSRDGGVYNKRPDCERGEVNNDGRFPGNVVWSCWESEYQLRSDVTPDQLRDLAAWMEKDRGD